MVIHPKEGQCSLLFSVLFTGFRGPLNFLEVVDLLDRQRTKKRKGFERSSYKTRKLQQSSAIEKKERL